MMIDDLKIIKKKYGEKMMQLCRSLFPTILNDNGALSSIMLSKFYPSRSLYFDIKEGGIVNQFESFINSLYFGDKSASKYETDKTPNEIFDELGYDFYECKTLDDVMRFKKYYAFNEELCTFSENRLLRNYVFWAVKRDAFSLNREDFINPNRQDEYGTSVISIQFTRNDSHTLSIKNRYNHTVNNCDATYNNNLDNIYKGLTYSFEKKYGLVQKNITNIDFALDGYVIANDGRYYKYNNEYSNIYYCDNNIIIDNFEVKKFEPEKYIIIDCYVVDLVNKTIKLYDDRLYDSFIDTVSNIVDIKVYKNISDKLVKIFLNDGSCYEISLNQNNSIIGVKNDSIKKVDDYFMPFSKNIKYLSLSNASEIGHCFLWGNKELIDVNLDSVVLISDFFLNNNEKLEHISLPNCVEIGNKFLYSNRTLKSFNLPNAMIIRDSFLYNNLDMDVLDLPNVLMIGSNFMSCNNSLSNVNIESVCEIERYFLYSNKVLKDICVPNLVKCGAFFLIKNNNVTVDAPSISLIEDRTNNCLQPYIEMLNDDLMVR